MPRKAPLARLRAIIEALPETSEKISHGAPTWWGGRKTFATYHDGHYDVGHHAQAVWIKAEPGAQEALIESDPETFYRPKYLGPAGWVGVRLRSKVDWARVEALLVDGYRLVAPKRALSTLAEAKQTPPRKASRTRTDRARAAKSTTGSKMKGYASYADWKRDQSARNQRLIGALQRLIEGTASHLQRTVKWGQGCFADGNAHKLYIHAADDHVQLGFYAGSTLDDPKGLLKGSGKYVRHIKVRSAADIQPAAFSALIRQVTE